VQHVGHANLLVVAAKNMLQDVRYKDFIAVWGEAISLAGIDQAKVALPTWQRAVV